MRAFRWSGQRRRPARTAPDLVRKAALVRVDPRRQTAESGEGGVVLGRFAKDPQGPAVLGLRLVGPARIHQQRADEVERSRLLHCACRFDDTEARSMLARLGRTPAPIFGQRPHRMRICINIIYNRVVWSALVMKASTMPFAVQDTVLGSSNSKTSPMYSSGPTGRVEEWRGGLALAYL
jgi:hypothetical protein